MKKIVPDPPLLTAGLETFNESGNPPVDMLRILPGIPAEHAYDEVMNLLACIRHLLHEGLMEQDARLLTAADYLSAFAKALMTDVERGRLH